MISASFRQYLVRLDCLSLSVRSTSAQSVHLRLGTNEGIIVFERIHIQASWILTSGGSIVFDNSLRSDLNFWIAS